MGVRLQGPFFTGTVALAVAIASNHKIRVMQSSNLVISLFSGAGGFSYGFSQAGLKPLFGAEIDADACSSYQSNVGSPCLRLDLRKRRSNQL